MNHAIRLSFNKRANKFGILSVMAKKVTSSVTNNSNSPAHNFHFIPKIFLLGTYKSVEFLSFTLSHSPPNTYLLLQVHMVEGSCTKVAVAATSCWENF